MFQSWFGTTMVQELRQPATRVAIREEDDRLASFKNE